MESWWWW